MKLDLLADSKNFGFSLTVNPRLRTAALRDHRQIIVLLGGFEVS
jgi:hypothetical protein